MEGYQTKRQYLLHLKKIAEIRDGTAKLPFFSHSINVSTSKSKQQLWCSSKSSIQCPHLNDSKNHTTTQRIMRDFTVQKENMRLVSKILRMNSSIPLKQYEQQYENSKKYLLKTEQRKRNQHKHVYLKLFDINFLHRASSPLDYYQITLVENEANTVLLKGTLFEIRKKELKLKKKADIFLRIQGKNGIGKVRISQESILDIRRRGAKVGHVVIEHISK